MRGRRLYYGVRPAGKQRRDFAGGLPLHRPSHRGICSAPGLAAPLAGLRYGLGLAAMEAVGAGESGPFKDGQPDAAALCVSQHLYICGFGRGYQRDGRNLSQGARDALPPLCALPLGGHVHLGGGQTKRFPAALSSHRALYGRPAVVLYSARATGAHGSLPVLVGNCFCAAGTEARRGGRRMSRSRRSRCFWCF